MSNEVTVDRLRELFDCDPEVGWLIRKVARTGTARRGSVAGSDNGDGYRTVGIDGRYYRVHRLVWFYVHGVWPVGDLDHINGDRSDNRIANLRPATRAENTQNLRGARRSNLSSGVLGVSRNGRGWKAEIRLGDLRVHIGTFPTVAEASAAYLQAKRALHPYGTL